MRSGDREAEAARTRSANSPARSPVSETIEVGKGRLSGVDMHGPMLDAAREGRDRLAWIEQARGIEGGLDGEEGLDLRRGELGAHLVDLLPADPVFAGD